MRAAQPVHPHGMWPAIGTYLGRMTRGDFAGAGSGTGKR